MGSDAVETVAFFAGLASLAWSAAYAWGQWLAHRGAGPVMQTAAGVVDSQRLARLEHSVELLAVEMERLGEGQRYTLRLLDERLPSPARVAGLPPGPGAASIPGRVATPH